MKGIVEEYGEVMVNVLIGGGVLVLGYSLFSAISPLVEKYITVIG